MVAADYGHIQSLDTLLERGAEVNSLDENGGGVLFYCLKSTNRHCVCIEKLLEAGADPNQVTMPDCYVRETIRLITLTWLIPDITTVDVGYK